MRARSPSCTTSSAGPPTRSRCASCATRARPRTSCRRPSWISGAARRASIRRARGRASYLLTFVHRRAVDLVRREQARPSAGETSTTSRRARARTTCPASLRRERAGGERAPRAGGPAAAAAPGARAGLLQRSQPERDRRAPGRAPRHREIATRTSHLRACASCSAKVCTHRRRPQIPTTSRLSSAPTRWDARARPGRAGRAAHRLERRLPPRLRGRARDLGGARAGRGRQRALAGTCAIASSPRRAPSARSPRLWSRLKPRPASARAWPAG